MDPGGRVLLEEFFAALTREPVQAEEEAGLALGDLDGVFYEGEGLVVGWIRANVSFPSQPISKKIQLLLAIATVVQVRRMYHDTGHLQHFTYRPVAATGLQNIIQLLSSEQSLNRFPRCGVEVGAGHEVFVAGADHLKVGGLTHVVPPLPR